MGTKVFLVQLDRTSNYGLENVCSSHTEYSNVSIVQWIEFFSSKEKMLVRIQLGILKAGIV